MSHINIQVQVLWALPILVYCRFANMSTIYIHLVCDCQFLASILVFYVNVSIFGKKSKLLIANAFMFSYYDLVVS